MKIILNGVSKKFKREWVIKNLSAEFSPEEPTVILGKNGSGKSTLLKVIAGVTLPFNGSVSYLTPDGETIKSTSNDLYKHLSIAAPYLDLIEEFTLEELVKYHQKFKPFLEGLNANDVIEKMRLSNNSMKTLKYFSSGMIQRVKLGLAIMSNTSVLLLDEPGSNLDKEGLSWYSSLLAQYSNGRCLIICSNSIEQEYALCTRNLNIEDYK